MRPPIPEASLFEQLAKYRGWRYRRGYQAARFPTGMPFVSVRRGPPRVTDCCSFVAGLVIPAASDVQRLGEFSTYTFLQLMVRTPDRFGPVTALCDIGLAEEFTGQGTPPNWSVVQGWRTERNDDGGHTFIVVRSRERRVLVLEANTGAGLDADGKSGVGWRGVGLLGVEMPPLLWWRAERCPTWGEICNEYPHRRIASLRVSDPVADLVDLGSPLPDPEPDAGGSVRALDDEPTAPLGRPW